MSLAAELMARAASALDHAVAWYEAERAGTGVRRRAHGHELHGEGGDRRRAFAVRAAGRSMDGGKDPIRDGDWLVMELARGSALSSIEGTLVFGPAESFWRTLGHEGAEAMLTR